jgi:hypothetical protein
VAHQPQRLTSSIVNNLTQSDWNKLKDPRQTLAGKMQVLIDRYLRLGIRYPDEQSVRGAVALVALVIAELSLGFPTYPAIFAMVKDFKAMCDSQHRPYPHGHLVAHPEHPSCLPLEMQQFAYDPEDG